MRVCIIGGTGHIGRFLTPMLVRGGHEVTVVTTGRSPVPEGIDWERVRFERGDYSPGDPSVPRLVADLACEVVIDILGAELPAVYQSARTGCGHLVACGSVWMFGPAGVIPTPPEKQGPCEFASYSRRYDELLAVGAKAAADGIAFTAIMPPNICGPGKVPLDNLGGRSVQLHRAMMRGEPSILPEGCNTLVGPCDAEDIAAAFVQAVNRRDAAAGEIFNVGSAYALTMPEFIQAYSRIYGSPIPLEHVPVERFLTEVLPDPGASFHFRHHMCPDISKTRHKLGYVPSFTPEQSMERAVKWMRDTGLLATA